jgi:mono/diheme cytochrome c family protein
VKRSTLALVAVALGGATLLPVALYDKGDWFPFERTLRALFNGWDMWETASVRPYEAPMPEVPSGTVPFGGRPGLSEAQAELAATQPSARAAQADVAYRRFCHHCHGPNGDGRIIVGESFDSRLPDLRSPAVQTQSDAQLYERVRQGGKVMIPLEDTLTPADTLLTIHQVRALAGAPSHPFFEARSTRPLE